MREYKKPEIQIEKFIPNVAVAACTAEDLHSLNTAKVDLLCSASGNEYDAVFGQGNGDCGNLICHYIWVNAEEATKYYYDDLKALGLTNLNCSKKDAGVTVPAGGAYVGCWYEKNSGSSTRSTSHYGLLTDIPSSVINASY